MRVNLQVTFAEKNAVKALGARWDGACKVWYIKDVEDLTPFQRWIPKASGFTDDGQSDVGVKTRKSTETEKFDTKIQAITTSAQVAHCGCDVLPWLDCVHTVRNVSSTQEP